MASFPASYPAFCPHCRRESQILAEDAGRVVACPNCHGQFKSPVPHAAPGYATHGYYRAQQINSGIKVCVLISAICNVLAGMVWISTICGVLFGVPLIVLAVFEFVYFAQADSKPLHESLSNAKTLGILEIIAGLFSGVSLICGILVLVFASQQQSQ